MNTTIRKLSSEEIEQISAGSIASGVAKAGLSGGATFGAIGAGIGSFAGPAGTLIGGLIGFGAGTVGGVYTFFAS